MKRFSIASLSAIALVTSVSFVSEMPVSASLKQVGTAIAQNVQRQQPQVQLNLIAAKKVMQKDQEGKPQVTWQPMQGNVVVQPGDVIRYNLNATNNSDRPANNLVFTQPVPQRTKYVLNSATADSKATKITYSIDNGKSFVAQPTVQVKLPDGKVETRPAPAEVYTHIRWNFVSAIQPKTTLKGTYQVQVK